MRFGRSDEAGGGMHRLNLHWQKCVVAAWAACGAGGAWAQMSHAELMGCLQRPAFRLNRFDPPSKPGKVDLGVGNVVLEMGFAAPDSAPQVRVLYDSLGRTAREAILDTVRQYRLPCLPQGQTFEARQVFNFTWAPPAEAAFPTRVSLSALLATMKNLQARPVAFDLDAMACPFQLTWQLGQPAFSNEVHEQGPRNPARAPLMAWLGELEMDVTPKTFERLVNSPLTVDVPCGTIKLG
jgi:hypothetical protein